MGRVTTRRKVLHVNANSTRERLETLAVEEPLEIRVDGVPVATRMRTAGHDVELAAGLLYTEGVVAQRSDIYQAMHCVGDRGENTYNVLSVKLAPSAPVHNPMEIRLDGGMSEMFAGTCGITSADLVAETHAAAQPPLPVSETFLASLPELLGEHQKTHRATRATQAAGLFTPNGKTLVVREDFDLVNAVDKAIGWALLKEQTLTDAALVVSGRATYEVLRRAAAAGVAVCAAISAPSAVAVDLAQRAGITLAAIQKDRMVVYNGAVRE